MLDLVFLFTAKSDRNSGSILILTYPRFFFVILKIEPTQLKKWEKAALHLASPPLWPTAPPNPTMTAAAAAAVAVVVMMIMMASLPHTSCQSVLLFNFLLIQPEGTMGLFLRQRVPRWRRACINECNKNNNSRKGTPPEAELPFSLPTSANSFDLGCACDRTSLQQQQPQPPREGPPFPTRRLQ
jgi:hypothetical protein